VRKAALQHQVGVTVNLDLPAALHPGALEAEIYAADAREQTAET
jgi:hypothetical protein